MGIGQWAMGIKDARFLMRVLIGFFPCPMPHALCPITHYEATGSASGFSSGMSCLIVR